MCRACDQIASLLRPVSSPPQGLPVGIASTDQQTYVEEEEDQTDTDDEGRLPLAAGHHHEPTAVVETLLTNAATLEENGEVTPRPIDRIRVKQSDSDSDTSGQDGTESEKSSLCGGRRENLYGRFQRHPRWERGHEAVLGGLRLHRRG